MIFVILRYSGVGRDTSVPPRNHIASYDLSMKKGGIRQLECHEIDTVTGGSGFYYYGR